MTLDSIATVLVVDDEAEIVELLTEWLEGTGYAVHGCHNATDALRIFFEKRPDLSVVDIRMPGMDGMELVSRIRQLSERPVLVLSALAGDQSVVQGLNLGADDYVVKPVSREVFLARVRSLLRRSAPEPKAPMVYADALLRVDLRTHELLVAETPVHLTPTEFRLLVLLVQNQERMLPYKETLDRVWGVGQGSLESLTWYVSSLRRKIEQDSQAPSLVINVRGEGYRYQRPPSNPSGAAGP